MATISINPGGIETLLNYNCAVAIAPLGGQSIATGLSSAVQLTLASSAKVSGGMSITTGASGVITVPYSGTYFCSFHAYRTSSVSASYDQQIAVYVNGTAHDCLRTSQVMDANVSHLEGSGVLWLTANDTVAARLAHNYSTSLGFNGATSYGQSSTGNNVGCGWLALAYIGN